MQLVVEVWREWMVTSLDYRFLINLKTCNSINSRKSRNRAPHHMPVNMVMTLITSYYPIHLLIVEGPCCLQTLLHTEIVKSFSDLAFTSSNLLPSIVWTLASELIYFLATLWGKYFTAIPEFTYEYAGDLWVNYHHHCMSQHITFSKNRKKFSPFLFLKIFTLGPTLLSNTK